MAVSKFSQEQSDKVLKWWEEARLEMVAEYGFDSFIETTYKSRGEFPSRYQESGSSLGFEFIGQEPVITRRLEDREASLVSYAGLAPGVAVDRLPVQGAVAMGADEEIAVLKAAMDNWDGIRSSFKRDLLDRLSRKVTPDSFKRYLQSNFTVDDARDESMKFWSVSRYMDRDDMDRVRSGVIRFVEDEERRRLESGGVDSAEVYRNISADRKRFDEIFSDWYVRRGQLNWRLSGIGVHRGELDAKDLESVAAWAQANPVFAPYGEELRHWVRSEARELGVRLSDIDEKLWKRPAPYERRVKGRGV